MLTLFNDSWNEVADKMKKEDPFFNKVYTDLTEFRARYDLWEANAFLPREGRASL